MIYVFLDTNIYDRVLTQGVPGCEIAQLHKLHELIEQRRVRLLLPEVVELEFEAFKDTLKNATNNGCDLLREKLKDEKATKLWNEVADVRADLLETLEELRAEKHKRADKHKRDIEGLLKLDGVERISLSPEIILRAKRRLIGKRMPDGRSRDQLLESDALIIESLIDALRGRDSSVKLFFCSENDADFGLEVEGQGIVLHPKIQPDLPKVVFRTTLGDLIAAINDHVPPPEPEKEAVEEAVERERRARFAVQQAANMLDSTALIDRAQGVIAARLQVNRKVAARRFDLALHRLQTSPLKLAYNVLLWDQQEQLGWLEHFGRRRR